MSHPNFSDDAEEMRDRIAWQQIFVGYGMVLIMLMIAMLHQLGFQGTAMRWVASGQPWSLPL